MSILRFAFRVKITPKPRLALWTNLSRVPAVVQCIRFGISQDTWTQILRTPMQSKFIPAFTLVVLLLVAARLFLLGWHYMTLNSDSQDNDQGGYLYMGVKIGQEGMLSDGTRGPVYSALLSPLASKQWSFFTLSKFLSLILGILTVPILYLIGRRLFGWEAGLLAAFGFGINTNLAQYAAFVLPETLLVLLFLLAWATMVLALRKDRAIFWALAGTFAALAYLTKGTGQLMMACFILSALLIRGVRIFTSGHFWLLMGAYCLVALPLWIYNTVHFGHPTFNYAITHQMWMNNWREWYNLSPNELPTLWSYLRSHSLEEILARQWQGMREVSYILAKAIYPQRSLAFDWFFASPWRAVPPALAVSGGVIFRRQVWPYARRRGAEWVVAACLLVVFYLLFSWYAVIIASVRFMLPLVPIVLLLLSDGVVQLVRALLVRLRDRRWRIAMLAVWVTGFILIFAWVPVTAWARRESLTKNIFQLDAAYNTYCDYPLSWLGQVTPSGTVVVKPSVKSCTLWPHQDHFIFKNLQDNIGAQTLVEFVQKYRAEYVIIQDRLAQYQKADLGTFFQRNDDGFIDIKSMPPGWALTLAYPSLPCRWCIFRVLDTAPLAASTHYRLGDTIWLQGYELSAPKEARPGEVVTLLLHWYFKHPTPNDLTIFTQLLGPDGRIHGQKDNYPLHGTVHTSQLPLGSHLIDRYDLRIDNQAPAGEYELLVGMYDAGCGKRAPAYDEGKRLRDDAIRLARIQIVGK